MKARLISSALLVASLSGCGSVPPNVNPTVEVWNVVPSWDTDVADVIVEQDLPAASSAVDASGESTSYSGADASSGCWFWCFSHARSSRQVPAASQPVAYFPVNSEAPRPATYAPSTSRTPVTKSTPRPAHVAAPKPLAARERKPQRAHTPAAKPSTPKPSKPAATSKSNTKKQKK